MDQSEGKKILAPENLDSVTSSRWFRVAKISTVIWILLSLPLIWMFKRLADSIRYSRTPFLESIDSMESVMVLVILTVTPLLMIAGVASISFLFLRSARSLRIASRSLLVSLLGMATFIAVSIAAAMESAAQGGDTGPLGAAISIAIGVVLPTLISIPSILALISLGRLKRIITTDS